MQKRTPWKAILTSRVVQAHIAVHLCYSFSSSLFLTYLPTYMLEILHFDIKQSGEWAALPYLACWLATLVSGVLSDRLIAAGIVSLTRVRKLFTLIGERGRRRRR